MNASKNPISVYMMSKTLKSSASKGVAIFVNEFGIKMFEIVLDGEHDWERNYLDLKLVDMVLEKCASYPMVNLYVSLYMFDVLKSKKTIVQDTALLSRIHSQMLVMNKRLRLGVLTARSVWNDAAKKMLSK